jgi:hypothetical protein
VKGRLFGTDELGVPLLFGLTQNYPNPFYGATNIGFELPVPVEVRLTVYNTLGERVATICDARFDKGTYAITWDASQQPSGVYFYRLQAGGFTDTRKLLILK